MNIKTKKDKAIARRKYRAARVAMQVALDRAFQQIFGEWDRDDLSTKAHIVGIHDILAVAIGSICGEVIQRGGDVEAFVERGNTLSAMGMSRPLVKTYRSKRARKIAKVIQLPVLVIK